MNRIKSSDFFVYLGSSESKYIKCGFYRYGSISSSVVKIAWSGIPEQYFGSVL